MTFAPYHTETVNGLVMEPLGEIPKATNGVPTMMAPAERRLLYSIAKNNYSGVGAIIDAGVFLGGSTVCFGQGVRDGQAGDTGECIYSFDQGLITIGMKNFFKRKRIHPSLDLGDDLTPIILDCTRDYHDLVDFRFGDIMEEAWDPDEKIEVCFIDLLKLPEINRHFVKTFFPAFIPGKTILIQQDYFYHRLPYIKVYQEFLGEYFEWMGMVRTSSIYRCVKPVPAEVAQRDLYAELDHGELIALHDKAIECASVDRGRQFLCALSGVELRKDLGALDDARAELGRLRVDYADLIESDDGGYSRRLYNEIAGLIA